VSPFRRKTIENAIVAILREQCDVAWTSKSLRPWVADRADGCSPAEFAAAVQALRYSGKLAWSSLELSTRTETDRAVVAAPEGPESGAANGPTQASAPSGPDDEEDYPGEVNDQAVEGCEGDGPVPAEGEARDGPTSLRPEQRALPGGRVEEPRPDAKDDQSAGAELRGQAARADAAAGAPLDPPWKAAFRKAGNAGGRHASATRAAARPLPVPQHETEVARAVREEVEENRDRRRRASSTATVRQPLELRKFGVPDMTFSEGLTSLLAEDPSDLMAAISRKHPKLWRRVILLGRASQRRTAEALYAALERGLDELEAASPQQQANAA
jgi:hypothetical protein